MNGAPFFIFYICPIVAGFFFDNLPYRIVSYHIIYHTDGMSIACTVQYCTVGLGTSERVSGPVRKPII